MRHGSTRDSTVPLLKKALKSCLAYKLSSQSLGEAIKAMHQCIDPFGLFLLQNNLLQLTRRVVDVPSSCQLEMSPYRQHACYNASSRKPAISGLFQFGSG